MRLLAIDVGNTSTAACLWNDGRVTRAVHCDGGFEEAAAVCRRILASSRVSAVAYASVVPEADGAWRAFASGAGLEFRTVDVRRFRAATGIRLDTPRPGCIGADRLADAAGAVERHGAPVAVMDFGTAFTASAVDSSLVWRGGAIAPGLPFLCDYLAEKTAKLPRIRLSRSGSGVPPPGRTTVAAMRFGAVAGFRGMVRETAAELSRALGEKLKIVATGGFAGAVLAGSDIEAAIDPDLTLYGTGLICAS